MSLGEYLAGAVLFLVGIGVPCAAALLVTKRRLSWMRREAQVAAWGVLSLAFVALTTGLPLLFGVLDRATVVVVALLIGVIALHVPDKGAAPESRARARSTDWARFGAIFAVGTAVVWTFAHQGLVAGTAIQDIDSTGFIIPTLKTWITTGTMWDGRDFVPEWALAAHPNSAGLVQLGAVVPWNAEFLLRPVNVAVIGLGAVATYALAVELGASAAWAAVAAALGALLPAGVVPGFAHAQTDSMTATGLVAGVLFISRFLRTNARSELALAALSLGLAFGAKWYGPPMVAAVLAAWAAIAVLRRRHTLRPVLLVGSAAFLLGAIWMVRNLVEFGSPLYPAAAVFFDAPARTGASALDFPLVHYADEPTVLLNVIAPLLMEAFTFAGLLLLAGIIAAAVLALRRREAVPLYIAIATGLVLVVYVMMPYTGMGLDGNPNMAGAAARYAVPGLLLAGAGFAWAATHAGRRLQAIVAVLACAAIVHELASYDAHSGGEVVVFRRALLASAIALVLIGGAAVCLRWWPVLRRPAFLVVAVAVLAVGRLAQEDQLSERFAKDAAFGFIQAQGSAELSIGLSGEMGGHAAFNAAAFGPRITHDVRFIGPRVDHLQLRDGEASAFVRRLRAAGLDYLVVADDPLAPAPEAQWAQAAGWTKVVRDGIHTVLAPPGRTGPVSSQQR